MNTDRLEIPHHLRRETIGLAPELRTHRISDEELTMLADAPQNAFAHMFSLGFGTILASAAPGLIALGHASEGLNWVDLLMIGLFCAAIPFTLAMGYFWYRTRKSVRALQEEIRSRHRLPVESKAELTLDSTM